MSRLRKLLFGAADLEAESAETRTAALEAAKVELASKHEAKVAQLKRQLHEAKEAHEHEVAKVEATEAAARATRHASIAAEIESRLYPAMAAFMAEPSRALAASIMAIWQAVAARTQHELGEPIFERHIGLAAAAALDRLACGGDNSFWSATGGCGGQVFAVERAIERGSVGETESALGRLEGAIENLCRGRRWAPNTQRVALMMGHATRGDAARALEAFDEAERVKERERLAAIPSVAAKDQERLAREWAKSAARSNRQGIDRM